MTQEQTDKERQQQAEQQQQQDLQQEEGKHDRQQPLQQERVIDTPTSTEQQAQNIVPPRPEVTTDASVLQTLQKEDLSRKRNRETPLTSSINQGEKRQRLNDFSEEDIAIRQALGMVPPNREDSASSFQQEQDRAMGGEVSSSSQQKEGQVSIKQ